jgi:hypothetical protein
MADSTTDTVEKSNPAALDRQVVARESRALIEQENLYSVLKSFKADTEEKEVALEFTRGYIQFIEETVENDRHVGLLRKEIEIRDLCSHANMLMRQRDESLFILLTKMSPTHYKAINKSMSAESAQKKA